MDFLGAEVRPVGYFEFGPLFANAAGAASGGVRRSGTVRRRVLPGNVMCGTGTTMLGLVGRPDGANRFQVLKFGVNVLTGRRLPKTFVPFFFVFIITGEWQEATASGKGRRMWKCRKRLWRSLKAEIFWSELLAGSGRRRWR